MKSIFYTLCSIFFVFSQTLNAQLPDEMFISDDGKKLYTGGQPDNGWYDETIIRTIHLDFVQPNFWDLLHNNYYDKINIPATMTVDSVVYENVGVRFKGNTSYAWAAEDGEEKLSFNITMDFEDETQDIMGYKTLNLNNCFEDPSFLREFLYLHLIRNHIPAAKASFVKLVINGENWGIYPNVQQLNAEYLEEWFLSNDGSRWRADRDNGSLGGPGWGWGDGTAALNDLGMNVNEYQEYYTLKSSTQTTPWQDLRNTCQAVDSAPLNDLENTLPEFLDIDRTLWFLACEILFVDDDSYVHKGKMDYYLYQDVETGRMTPLEFDGNSCMMLDEADGWFGWSPFYNANDPNYPLLNRLLAVPSLRQRYLAHVRTLLLELLDPAFASIMIDSYAAMIEEEVQNDDKKLYSYGAFLDGLDDLKEFFEVRYDFILENNEVYRSSPTINDVTYSSDGFDNYPPLPTQTVDVRASVYFDEGVSNVYLYYGTDLLGNFEKTEMFDDGLHNDGLANDGLYAGTIPMFEAASWVRYYIEAVADNSFATVTYEPVGAEHDVFVYQVRLQEAVDKTLSINELMASNSNTVADQAGDYDDWIELYNLTDENIDLSGYFLTDGTYNVTKWEFPLGTTIAANDYLIVWTDENGSQEGLHANFKLNKAGERLRLVTPSLELMDEIVFTEQQSDIALARVPNGTGEFVMQEATFAENNAPFAANVTNLQQHELGITIYPNPATNIISLTNKKNVPTEFQIFNTLGKQIFSETLNKNIQIDISLWPSGFYMLKTATSSQEIVVVK
ncbi:MAG: CotH kinase family protein [Chitinophagales bacterium]